MFTIGNNDLCGKQIYELGNGSAGTYKVNHINMVLKIEVSELKH